MSTQYTVQREGYSPALRIANAVATLCQSLRLPFTCVKQDSILQAAKKSTGLADWGDESFLQGMETLIHNVENSDITALGRIACRASFITGVSNRLRIEDHLAQNPAILQTTVKRPIFVLGFPRTGTTLLQNLLALDPKRRALQFWELSGPVPLHKDAGIDRTLRTKRAQRMIDIAYAVAPEQRYIHEITATTPEECWPLFVNTFSVLNFDLQSSLTEYGDWLLQRDMVDPYTEYKRQLRILLHHNPAEQLLLKCPEHLWFLDALLEVFPDALIVWTHRDPVACIASYCSLISLNQRMWYGQIENKWLGTHITNRFLQGVERAMAVRDRVGPEQFFDVDFHSLVRDPASVMSDLHEHFQLDEGGSSAAAISAYLSRDHRNDGIGKHVYKAERYGLVAREIHERYARYIERFAIPVKRAA